MNGQHKGENMENITLGQIAIAVALVVGILTGAKYLNDQIKEWFVKSLQTQFDEIKEEIKAVREELRETDLESTKNFLVSFLSGVEKCEQINEAERLRFWEEYEHYSKLGGNSYIKEQVEKFKAKGWL